MHLFLSVLLQKRTPTVARVEHSVCHLGYLFIRNIYLVFEKEFFHSF